MVVLTTFDLTTIFEKSKVTYDEKDQEEGSTKNGEAFMKRKFKYLDDNERKTSLIVRFFEVESWGLKEFKNKNGGKSYSFSIILDLAKEEIIKEFIANLEKTAKKGFSKKARKSISFEKFPPVRNSVLYCRVPFNPQNESFFCRFQDRGEIGRPEDFKNAECLVDAAVQFEGVYVNFEKQQAFLRVSLLQVRKLEERILLDYLGPYKPKETPFKAQANKERDQTKGEED